jgi:peptidoglycan/xylan/chitin deacetylase (PgdA/CDA1 family)
VEELAELDSPPAVRAGERLDPSRWWNDTANRAANALRWRVLLAGRHDGGVAHETRGAAAEAGAEFDAAATVAGVRPRLRRGARFGTKAVAAGADLLRRGGDGAVVLLYHQVGAPRPSAVNLTAARFSQQLDHLVRQGRVGSLDELVVAVRRDDRPLHDPPRFAITFDDGTADFVEVALPILERMQLPVTLYVATQWIEDGRSFWDDGTVLSWSALQDALQTGLVTIGSHTHSHALLDRSPAAAVTAELDRSIGLIEDNLGVTPQHFAYPKALPPSPAADLEVRARFRSAAVAGTKANPYRATDPFLLARSPVQVDDGLVWFRRKAAGGMRLEDELREVVNRRRYAGAQR